MSISLMQVAMIEILLLFLPTSNPLIFRQKLHRQRQRQQQRHQHPRQILRSDLLAREEMQKIFPKFTPSSCIRMTAFDDDENDGNDNDDDGLMKDSSSPFATLHELLRPHADSTNNVDRMSPTDLAYIGDVVYEMAVRSWAVWPPKRTSDLQRIVVELVRAEYQSDLLQSLKQQQEEKCTAPPLILTTQELQVLNRGRNSAASVASGRRGARKNPGAYQDATALEALLGYLYITDIDRCTLFLQWIRDNIEEQHHWLGET